MTRSTIWLGRLGLAFFVVGPLLAHFALVSSMTGFGLFALGSLIGGVGMFLGIIDAIRSRGRGGVWRGLIPATLVVAVVVVVAGRAGKYPAINDITTDTRNPPRFVKAPRLPGNSGRDMRYPGEGVAAQQRAGYGELGAVRRALPADEAFARVREAARRMAGWVITREDASARALEGVDTTWLFRFKDDFVIEVRDAGGHGIVHMRSKSRDGKGDVGANAQRIRSFLAKLSQ